MAGEAVELDARQLASLHRAQLPTMEQRLILQAELGISGRAASALLVAGIDSLTCLKEHVPQPAALYAVKNIGRKLGDEIVGALIRRKLIGWI